MPLGPIKDIADAAPRGAGPLLAIDPGAKTLGLALSDPAWRLSVPLGTLRRTKFTRDAQALSAMLAEHGAAGVVVGWPLSMDGTVGPRAQSARDFAAELHRFLGTDPWIAMMDERLSTAAAREALEGARPRKAKAAGHLDALAAHTILEGALDVLNAGRA